MPAAGNRRRFLEMALCGTLSACAAGSVATAIAPDAASARATRIAGHRRSDPKKSALSASFNSGEHGRLAPEEMSDARDIENKIAIRRAVGHQADKR